MYAEGGAKQCAAVSIAGLHMHLSWVYACLQGLNPADGWQGTCCVNVSVTSMYNCTTAHEQLLQSSY